MRHYPSDSPKAAARVIALALLADGAIDPSELATLSNRRTLDRLGLSEGDFDAVIHALCEDLMLFSHRAAAGHLEIGREALRDMLAELHHPELRKRLHKASTVSSVIVQLDRGLMQRDLRLRNSRLLARRRATEI